MKNKLSHTDVLSLLTAAGIVASTGAVIAANPTNQSDSSRHSTLKVSEHHRALGSGKENACGKGSCGTDEKGAAAAKDRDKKKSDKSPAAKSEKSKGDAAAKDKKPDAAH